jgi:hypothetical protein
MYKKANWKIPIRARSRDEATSTEILEERRFTLQEMRMKEVQTSTAVITLKVLHCTKPVEQVT